MMLNPAPTTTTPTYSGAVQQLLSSGWQVVAETAHGTQFQKPRIMRSSTKVVLVLGIVGLLAMGAGLILIIVGLVDYYALTKEQSYFLSRETPTLPTAEAQRMPVAIKILIVLVLAIIIFAAVGSVLKP